MSERVSLRPVTSEDEGFLRLVYAEGRREELAQVAWPKGALEAFVGQQFAAQSAHYAGNYPGAEFQVVLLDGEPVGRLYVHRGGSDIRIMEIGLLPGARGRGIGTGLLQGILDEGQATGRVVSIHVEKFNPALRLYERLGFQIAGDRDVYWLLHRAPVS